MRAPVNQLRILLSSLLLAPLRFSPYRKRAIFHLKREQYEALSLEVPLGNSMVCPVTDESFWFSFSEVFVNGEYVEVFKQIPLPSRWLDLGCHAGYFSLYTAWLRQKAGFSDLGRAFLVDGDSRLQSAVDCISKRNPAITGFQFATGVISSGDGVCTFVQREYMSSSKEGLGEEKGRRTQTPILSEAMLLQRFPGPFDLLKVDIEGGEYDLFTSYQAVLSQTRHLVLEWHSWHSGGGGEEQLKQAAKEAGFEMIAVIGESRSVDPDGKQTCGVWLLENRLPAVQS